MRKIRNMANLKKSNTFIKNYTDDYVDIVDKIANNVKNIIIYNKPYSIYYDNIYIIKKNIDISVKLVKTENINNLSVSGETLMIDKPNLINIRVEYPKYAYKTNIEYLMAELKDCIRHEIQHWIQIINNTFTMEELGINFNKNMYQYYLLEHEIEAHVYGLIYNSKENGKTMYDNICDFLKTWRELTPYQKDMIKKEYEKYFMTL